MKRILVAVLLVVGCDTGPSTYDYIGCAGACGVRGVAEVTYSRCRCAGEVRDGGAR